MGKDLKGKECGKGLSQRKDGKYSARYAAKNSSYDTHPYKLCKDAGIKPFSMHALRHTYAARAIESGMQPKVLQQLLGHSSIKTTMDTYVHVTTDSLTKAVQQFETNNTNMVFP